KTLVSVTAYHSFGGEVEASSTPTIRRLIPSCRHQFSPIALLEGWNRVAYSLVKNARSKLDRRACHRRRPLCRPPRGFPFVRGTGQPGGSHQPTYGGARTIP